MCIGLLQHLLGRIVQGILSSRQNSLCDGDTRLLSTYEDSSLIPQRTLDFPGSLTWMLQGRLNLYLILEDEFCLDLRKWCSDLSVL